MTQAPPITVLEEVGSTNDVALEAAHAGAPHGAMWLADRQTAGRGRREVGGARRPWYSPSGANLYTSLLLRPALTAPAAASLTLAAALAARRALVEAGGPSSIWIKWPNDLYLGERKLAGILTEGVMASGELSGVIVGLGINVNLRQEELPEELSEVATSLSIVTGARFDRLAIAVSLRRELLAACARLEGEGLAPIVRELRQHDRTVGRRVEVMRGQGWAAGTSRGVDDHGHLRVELDGGVEVAVQAGEVRFAAG